MRTSRHRGMVLGCTLAFANSPGGAATVIFEQTVNTDLFGVISDSEYSLDDELSQVLDDFVPVATASIQAIEWYGSPAVTGAAPIADSSYLVRMYMDINGQPSATPFYSETVIASPLDVVASSVRDQYRYAANLTGPSVVLGTTYYLSIVETNPDTSSSFGDPVWGWANGDNSATLGSYALNGITGDWEQTTYLSDKDFAFTLYDSALTAVPVPAALWLFSGGLLGLAGLARRGGAAR